MVFSLLFYAPCNFQLFIQLSLTLIQLKFSIFDFIIIISFNFVIYINFILIINKIIIGWAMF